MLSSSASIYVDVGCSCATTAAAAIAASLASCAAMTAAAIAASSAVFAACHASIAGSYGSASAIPAITVDAKGRVTSISTNAVSAGITAQNCSYTGSVVELAGFNPADNNQYTRDLGSNRVMTGLRKYFDGCAGQNYLYVRGYNIKNTA